MVCLFAQMLVSVGFQNNVKIATYYFTNFTEQFFLYKKADQEENKFLVNVLFSVFMLIIAGIVLNMYVWSMGPCPPPEECIW